MNSGVYVCGGSCLLCLLLALIFTVLKGKSAMLISGFNTLEKEKRKLYDTEKMSLAHRNMFLIWAAILGIGAILSYLFSGYFAVAAFIVWLAVFFRNVHLDEEKAFGKYKIKQ